MTICLIGSSLLFSCKAIGPHNPYIDSKEKPSTTIKKSNEEGQKKAKRLSKRQLRKTKRMLYSY